MHDLTFALANRTRSARRDHTSLSAVAGTTESCCNGSA